MNDKLNVYRNRRDFNATSEPSGNGGRSRGARRFVIQKHDASRLHYDLRLEIDGVLVSWAVPKGLSTDPTDKRLAIQTEDHPLDYIDFEGVIPEGEYGAGTVLVWDSGTYRNLRAKKGRNSVGMEDAIKDGLIEVWLQGQKIQGGYAMKRTDGGRKPRWLLIKMVDEHADARRRPTHTQPDSVKTGRSLDKIAEQETPQDG
jgi:DNA ligase D-like protein (predicted 3'-phosphoesterase)